MQIARLLMLLNELDGKLHKTPPKGVGLKTVIEAREHGLVALGKDWRSCVLTERGLLLRENIRHTPSFVIAPTKI